MRSLKSLAREAYKCRYGFSRVSIDADGKLQGHWGPEKKFDPVQLGNLADCRTAENGRDTGTHFYNRDFRVYTFAAGGFMRTTQQQFHSMSGHVADGCEIQMDNGDLLTLKGVHGGWQLFKGDTPQMVPTNSAHVVECVVYSYPEDIGP